jgi:hypothetical protein
MTNDTQFIIKTFHNDSVYINDAIDLEISDVGEYDLLALMRLIIIELETRHLIPQDMAYEY